jgi:antitoxin CptB
MDEDHKRMQWASRRGMLELDLILEPFVREAYPQLSSQDRERYQQLMSSQDQEMFGWFLRREVPEDEELAVMVRRILEFHGRAGRS